MSVRAHRCRWKSIWINNLRRYMDWVLPICRWRIPKHRTRPSFSMGNEFEWMIFCWCCCCNKYIDYDLFFAMHTDALWIRICSRISTLWMVTFWQPNSVPSNFPIQRTYNSAAPSTYASISARAFNAATDKLVLVDENVRSHTRTIRTKSTKYQWPHSSRSMMSMAAIRVCTWTLNPKPKRYS